ncbi:unnamed protein product, partial [Cercopithifilaria johnstoni]
RDCIRFGSKYKDGEQFAINHLRYECKDGTVNILGCYMNEIGQNLEIGRSIVDKLTIYKCLSENGEVRYEEYPCGLQGMPPCEVPKQQKQQTPIKVPTVRKPIPGSGTFNIMQVG